MSTKLELKIERILKEYPFLTEQQKDSIRAEYNESIIPLETVEKNLLIKIKEFTLINKKSNLIPVTDFADCSYSDGAIQLHLNPVSIFPHMKKTVAQYEKNEAKKEFGKFLESNLAETMSVVAGMVSRDENVLKILVTSRLVQIYEDVFDSFGFSIRKFTDEELAKIFPAKSAAEKENFRCTASIDRSTILKNYYSPIKKK